MSAIMQCIKISNKAAYCALLIQHKLNITTQNWMHINAVNKRIRSLRFIHTFFCYCQYSINVKILVVLLLVHYFLRNENTDRFFFALTYQGVSGCIAFGKSSERDVYVIAEVIPRYSIRTQSSGSQFFSFCGPVQ